MELIALIQKYPFVACAIVVYFMTKFCRNFKTGSKLKRGWPLICGPVVALLLMMAQGVNLPWKQFIAKMLFDGWLAASIAYGFHGGIIKNYFTKKPPG